MSPCSAPLRGYTAVQLSAWRWRSPDSSPVRCSLDGAISQFFRLPSMATQSSEQEFYQMGISGPWQIQAASLYRFSSGPTRPSPQLCCPRLLGPLSLQTRGSLTGIHPGGPARHLKMVAWPQVYSSSALPSLPTRQRMLQCDYYWTGLLWGLQHTFLNFCASKLAFSHTISTCSSIIYDCAGNSLLLNRPDFWLWNRANCNPSTWKQEPHVCFMFIILHSIYYPKSYIWDL